MDFETIFYLVIAIIYFLFTASRKAAKNREAEASRPVEQKEKNTTFEDVFRELLGDKEAEESTPPIFKPEPAPKQKVPERKYFDKPSQSTGNQDVKADPKPTVEVDFNRYLKEKQVKPQRQRIAAAPEYNSITATEIGSQKESARLNGEKENLEFNLRQAIIYQAILSRPHR